MSVFGGRIALANKLIDNEFAHPFFYQPMVEVVNADPAPDSTRASGECRVIILQPGMTLGQGWSLNAMHERSTSEPMIYYMARDLLIDVRKPDRFYLRNGAHNPDVATGTRAYEVGDGPRPIGFGRYQARMVEIPLFYEAVDAIITFAPPAVTAEIVFTEDEIPF